MSLLPSFRRPSTRTSAPGKPVGAIVEYFGLVGAVWQCFYSTVEYAYARQKKDNPIKMCLLPFIFLSCVVISKLIKKSYINKSVLRKAARWRLPAEWLAESDLDTAVPLEELSPFKSLTSGFDFFDFESLRASSLGVPDEVFPLCVGGTACNSYVGLKKMYQILIFLLQLLVLVL
ncbi:hypothetical protein DKX38_026977 [Salix brachista]|uniref:Uncharacterized protein n=1 Tax=Salix brachista TaxID=2182728 RepID=A0A5N5JAV3_9ROSI|nr:hypothetical protein DKX38_026977 [Salix brachista]